MEQSVFDPKTQNNNTADRIVASFEKIARAFRVLLWEESKKNGLSPIQIQILIFVLYQPAKQTTITNLAREFNLTKATVSDSVKILERKNLVLRTYHNAGNRSFTLSLSTHGVTVAESSSIFAKVMKKPLQSLEQNQTTSLLHALLEIIHQLASGGIISRQRMCKTCRFFHTDATGHYCTLIKQTLLATDLRLDCPEHEPR